MSEENSGILVGERAGVIIVRVAGKGTHLNSRYLKQFVLQCLQEKSCAFQIELSQCTYLDSTFLGMLAGLGGKVKEKSLSRIKLVNVTERVQGMLEGLGIDSMFELIQERVGGGELKELQGKPVDVVEKSRDMLEAHEKLVEISPGNEEKFRDVIVLLREKVNRTGKS